MTYTIWILITLLVGFIVICPFLLLFLCSRRTWFVSHKANIFLGRWIFFWASIPVKRVWKFKPQRDQRYIYCANHTSYFDIPTLFVSVPGFFNIIGKSELKKLPLFGYMFNKLYIAVDRSKRLGQYESFKKSLESLDSGRSMCFFPEGTIPKQNAPQMIHFKDGAFKAAIEKQIDIVPVSIPYNWIILGAKNGSYAAKRHVCKIIFHEPVSTQGKTEKDINEIKSSVFNTIDSEIKKQNKSLIR